MSADGGFSAWTVPVWVASIPVIGTLLTAWLGFVRSRTETSEAQAERITLATIKRMDDELRELRELGRKHDEEIARLHARIRAIKTKAHRWFIWAHDLREQVLFARSLATPPETGWKKLPELPLEFDIDDDMEERN